MLNGIQNVWRNNVSNCGFLDEKTSRELNELKNLRILLMEDEEKDETKKEDEKLEPIKEGLFGITEAPKDHPLNTNGNLKIIME